MILRYVAALIPLLLSINPSASLKFTQENVLTLQDSKVYVEDIHLYTGSTKFISPKKHLVIDHLEGAICEVTVLNLDREMYYNAPGRLYPSSFPCNFTSRMIQYINFGEAKNDRIPLQIRYDTEDSVLIERVNLNILVEPGHYITNPTEKMQVELGKNVQLVPEILGISSSLDKKNCKFTILRKGLNSFSDIGIFDKSEHYDTDADYDSSIDIAWPRYGQVEGIVPGQYYSCDSEIFETLGSNIVYKHNNDGSSLNFDKIPFHLVFTQQSDLIEALNNGMDEDFEDLEEDYSGSRRTRSAESDVLSEFMFYEVQVLDAPVNTPPMLYDSNPIQLNFNEHTITPITSDVLYAYDKETEYSSDIEYNIKSEHFLPDRDEYPHGYIANTNNMEQPISNFNQYEIDGFKIVFVPPKNSKTAQWPQTLDLKLSDSLGASYPKDINLAIALQPSSTWAPVVKTNKGISLFKGQSRKICKEELEFFHHNVSINLNFLNGTKHGKLIYMSQPVTRTTDIKLEDIEKNCGNLIYQHDESEATSSDNTVFRAVDIQGNEIIFLLPIQIIDRDDSPPILARNVEQTMIMGDTLYFNKRFLQAKDPDSADSSISFELVNKLKYGNLINYNTRSNCTQWKHFNTCDGTIYYEATKNIDIPVQEVFEFTLKDARGNQTPNVTYTFVINIMPQDNTKPQRCVSEFEPINVVGPGSTDIKKSHLCYFDDFSDNGDIQIELTHAKCNGAFYSKLLKRNVTKFYQDEIDYNKIVFKADYIRYAAKKCPVNLQICDKANNCKADRVHIQIEPINLSPPSVTAERLLSVNGEAVTLDRRRIVIEDNDSTQTDLTIEITKFPVHGSIQHRINNNAKKLSNLGKMMSDQPKPLALSDIKSDRLEYKPKQSYFDTYQKEVNSPVILPQADRPTTDDFILKISDGKNDVYQTVHVDFTWDRIAGRENLTDFKLDCREGNEVMISNKYLSSANSQLQYEVDAYPLKGRVVTKATGTDVDTFTFSQGDVDLELIWYIHDMGEETGLVIVHDEFQISINNIKNIPITVDIDILPVDNSPPVIKNTEFKVEARESLPVALPIIEIEDDDTQLQFIFCEITQQPKHGIIDNIAPERGSEISRKDKPITKFSAQDSADGSLRYNPTNMHGHGKEPIRDSFRFVCEDLLGNQALNNGPTVTIDIQPENDETPTLLTTPIIVKEGGTKKIDESTIKCEDADRYQNVGSLIDDLYIVFEDMPYNGKIIYPTNYTTKVTGGYVSADPLMDSSDRLGSQGSYDESDYYGDQYDPYANDYYDDYFTEYTGQTLKRKKRAQSAYIYATLGKKIPYGVIQAGMLFYEHNSKEEFEDSFKIKCLDNGKHSSTSRTIAINVVPVNDESPRVTTNAGLFIKATERREILKTMLSATDKDTDNAKIVYMLTDIPKSGYLYKNYGLDDQIKFVETMNFTQDDVNHRRISYQHNEIKGKRQAKTRDQFKFDLFDGRNRNSNKYFMIQVQGKDRIFPDVVNKGITLSEGGRVTITTDLLSTADINSPDLDLEFKVLKEPKYGKLINTNDRYTKIDKFTQLELVGNNIQYVHTDVDEKRSDTFEFSVSDGYNYLHRTFRISILNVDNKIPQIEEIGEIRCNEGDVVEITPFEIKVSDSDTHLKKVMMTIKDYPKHGSLKLNGGPATSFSMEDVKQSRLVYRHDGSETSNDKFSFTISDGTHNKYYKAGHIADEPIEMDVTIAPHDNKLPMLVTNKPIRYLEYIGRGRHQVGAIISRLNLKSVDEDSTNEDIIYQITRNPNYGYIAKNSTDGMIEAKSFTQEEIANRQIFYILEGTKIKTITSDNFMFDLTDRGGNTIPNKVFDIHWSYVAFEKEEYVISENKETYLKVTLKRRGDTSQVSFVHIDLHNKTAKTHQDVRNKVDSQVSFDVGQTKAIWRVKIIKDEIYEGQEEIGVSISRPHGTLLEKPVRANVILTDEDDKAKMGITKEKIEVKESIGEVMVPIERTGDLSKISSVICYTEAINKRDGGGATPTGPSPLRSHNDYIHRPRQFSSTIQFQEGQKLKMCPVIIIDDSLYEKREAFKVRIADAWTGMVDAAHSEVSVTILPDKKDIPTFYFDTTTYIVDESNKYLEVVIWRNGADLVKESSVMFSTRTLRKVPDMFTKDREDDNKLPMGLARAGLDYYGLNKVVRFAKNDTMQKVRISIIDDFNEVRMEGQEVFQIILTKPIGGNLGKQSSSYVIIDDTESDRPTICGGFGITKKKLDHRFGPE